MEKIGKFPAFYSKTSTFLPKGDLNAVATAAEWMQDHAQC